MIEFAATYQNKEHQITYKEFDTVEAFKKFTYDNRDTLEIVFYSGGTSLWKPKNIQQRSLFSIPSIESIETGVPPIVTQNEVQTFDTTEDDNLSDFFHQIRLYQLKRGVQNDRIYE